MGDVKHPRRGLLGHAIEGGVARYRFRRTFARHWGSYAVLAVLIAGMGGIAMGAVAAARRTQSSYPAFLAQTDASDLTMSTYGTGASSAGATYYSPKLAAAIARVPGVRHVESWVGVFAVPLLRNGAPNFSLNNDVNFAASENGLYFHMDRVTPIEGRLPNSERDDEFMTTALGAHLMGVRLGQVVPVGLYTQEQANLSGFGTPQVPPAQRFNMKLVGIIAFNNQVVEDDTDRLPTNVVYTPAFTRLIPNDATQGTWYGIQLDHPAHSLSSIEEALLHVLPPGAVGNFSVTATTEAKVERAVRPESIALGVFGLIAALATLATALPIISRLLRSTESDREVLRALGAGPATTLVDGLGGILTSIVVGSLLACVVAVVLSPVAPLGPIRSVFHPGGINFDWTVLGGGFGLLVLGLVAASLVIGLRTAPQRLARQDDGARARTSKLPATAAALGLPLPGVVGLHLAFEPGRGRTAVPARSVLVGAIVAVTTVTATLTFGNSLHVLVTHPQLYGWNWNYTLMSENGVPPQAITTLRHDRDVASWSGFSDPNLQIDGQTVPALITPGIPSTGPPILSGHGLTTTGQVVLGASTLAQLHKHIGSSITISYGTPNTAPLYLPPQPAVVVGTATFPAIAGASTFAEHTSMGVGALIPTGDVPASFIKETESPDPTLDGPSLVFVRLRSAVTPDAGRKDMTRVTTIADKAFANDPNGAGDSVSVLTVQRPAEIVNYQSTGGTPRCSPPVLVPARRSPWRSPWCRPFDGDGRTLRFSRPWGSRAANWPCRWRRRPRSRRPSGSWWAFRSASWWADSCGSSSPGTSMPCPSQPCRDPSRLSPWERSYWPTWWRPSRRVSPPPRRRVSASNTSKSGTSSWPTGSPDIARSRSALVEHTTGNSVRGRGGRRPVRSARDLRARCRRHTVISARAPSPTATRHCSRLTPAP